jgi:ATP-dependent helicase/nuclease subunit B
MHITFGIDLDGSPWTYRSASVGAVHLGPEGLLSLLETRLGLAGPPVHPAQRIDQYLARLEALDRPDAWFHESFSADPWATARQLLAWRDELVEAGWDGAVSEDASPRLVGLARMERVRGLPLAPGRPDRLRAVLDAIRPPRTLGIERVRLVEPLRLLPPVWRTLFHQLEAQGAAVEPLPDPTLDTEPGTHLGQLRRALEPGARTGIRPVEGDESLLLLDAEDEWEAAEALALWLETELDRQQASRSPDTGASPEITLIAGAGTEVFDQALAARGLPTVGRSAPSGWRGVLQSLPLLLANLWRPVDVHRLAELLLYEAGPVAPGDARLLLGALGRQPGVGGAEWTAALDRIESRRAKRLGQAGASDPERRARLHRTELDRRLATARFDSQEGVPTAVLVDRCDWIIQTLQPRMDSDPLAAVALTHARELKALAQREKPERTTIPRVTLERILDSVVGTGEPAPDRTAQAAPWTVIRSPGQLVGPTSTVLWWGFTHGHTAPATWWTQPELRVLTEARVRLYSGPDRREREARSWRRPLEMARDRLLLFTPKRHHGEPQDPHPLWDEIRYAATTRPDSSEGREIEAVLRRPCAELVQGGRWSLADREHRIEHVSVRPPPPAGSRHRLRGPFTPSRTRTSFSNLSSLIGCPFHWAMNQIGLRAPNLGAIPTGNQLLGSFCHAIVETLYGDDPETPPVRSPTEAASRAGEIFDALVDVWASELLLPGRELDKHRFRAAVCSAIRSLAEALDRHGLRVEATEAPLERACDRRDPDTPLGCHSVRGIADLVLRGRDGARYVLDLKWSSSSKYRKEEIESGTALQLSVYAWMLREDPQADPVHAGYFMLAQGELLSPEAGFGEEGLSSPRTLDEAWRRGVRSWNRRWSTLLDQGVLEASGVLEDQRATSSGMKPEKVRDELRAQAEEGGLLYVRPPCSFCDFGPVCGLSGRDA